MRAAKKKIRKVAAVLRQSRRVPAGDIQVLVRDLGAMIDGARDQVAVTADATLAALYWQIGERVRTR